MESPPGAGAVLSVLADVFQYPSRVSQARVVLDHKVGKLTHGRQRGAAVSESSVHMHAIRTLLHIYAINNIVTNAINNNIFLYYSPFHS
jgi:hypothetical protein